MAANRERNVWVWTGQYHISVVKDDKDYFFKMIEGLSKHKQLFSFEKTDQYSYKIMNYTSGDDYCAASLNRVNRQKTEECYSDGNISDVVLDNCLEGYVWFYFDKSGNAIIENNKVIGKTKFIKIMDGMIDNYLLSPENTSDYNPLMGGTFEITFDRRKGEELHIFFTSKPKIVRIESKVLVSKNPFRDKCHEEDKNAFMAIRMKKVIIENNEGLNKDSEVLNAIMDLTEDGHLDTTVKGMNDEGLFEVFRITSSDDNSENIGKIGRKDISKFVSKSQGIIRNLLRRRDDRTP